MPKGKVTHKSSNSTNTNKSQSVGKDTKYGDKGKNSK